MTATIPDIQSRFGGHAAVDAELAALYERTRHSVVQVYHGNGNGAGTIWRPDGLIITNNHVAGRSNTLQIVLSDGRQFDGHVSARNAERDLALVEVDATDLPAAEIGDSSRVRPGQLVVSIGHPYGQVDMLTAGIICAAGQTATEKGLQTGDLLQMDARIGPGNSGGPLIDIEGRVLGINVMVAGRMGMAIPSVTVERFVAGLVPGGAHAYLGVNGVIAQLPGSPTAAGFVLTDVVAGSPADRAGLMQGDVIRTIAGHDIVDQESIPAAMLRVRAGQEVEIGLTRGGDPRTFFVVPTEQLQPR
ncbi:MAG: trypsin-like peptidase domain-containing protein [Thermomicrobiales bacterium]|nr:trypsin-like peptidase domain-containing protein [Thermomicrobiales bacterium]